MSQSPQDVAARADESARTSRQVLALLFSLGAALQLAMLWRHAQSGAAWGWDAACAALCAFAAAANVRAARKGSSRS